MSRRKVKTFGSHDFLGGIISALEQHVARHAEPSTACATLLGELTVAFDEFKQSITTLHAAGQLAGVEILVGDFMRVSRRAVRIAAEHGAPSAPQTLTGAPNASAGRSASESASGRPLTTSQGDVSDGL